jgi:serine/threonine protein kinase
MTLIIFALIVLKLVNHPNIIRMEGLYENKNNIYIVMEKLSGGELFERIGNPFRHSILSLLISSNCCYEP